MTLGVCAVEPRRDIVMRLGCVAVRSYLLLCERADGEGVARCVSYRQLGGAVGASGNGVRDAIRRLEGLRAIETRPTEHDSRFFDVRVLPQGGGAVPLVRTGQGDYARDYMGGSSDAERE